MCGKKVNKKLESSMHSTNHMNHTLALSIFRVRKKGALNSYEYGNFKQLIGKLWLLLQHGKFGDSFFLIKKIMRCFQIAMACTNICKENYILGAKSGCFHLKIMLMKKVSIFYQLINSYCYRESYLVARFQSLQHSVGG